MSGVPANSFSANATADALSKATVEVAGVQPIAAEITKGNKSKVTNDRYGEYQNVSITVKPTRNHG